MARPTPVLPDVGSTMVPPGLRSPSRSAASIIGECRAVLDAATRVEEFQFGQQLARRSRPIRSRRTIGVLPTRSSNESAAWIAGPRSLMGRISIAGSTMMGTSLSTSTGRPAWWSCSATLFSQPRPSSLSGAISPTERGIWARRSAMVSGGMGP